MDTLRQVPIYVTLPFMNPEVRMEETRAKNRARELFTRLGEVEEQLLKLQAERDAINAELDELIPDKPRTRTRRAVAQRNESVRIRTAARNERGTNGSKRSEIEWGKKGALLDAIREAFRTHPGEWTARQIIEKAGVPPDRLASAKAAVSRLFKGEEIEKGTKDNAYRLKGVQQ
jgi:hypothetical protein